MMQKKTLEISAFWLTILSRFLVSFSRQTLLLLFSSIEILPGQFPVILYGHCLLHLIMALSLLTFKVPAPTVLVLRVQSDPSVCVLSYLHPWYGICLCHCCCSSKEEPLLLFQNGIPRICSQFSSILQFVFLNVICFSFAFPSFLSQKLSPVITVWVGKKMQR